MLKLVTIKKLKEDYPDIKIRMELPGGLDINRVTLPVILNTPAPALTDQKLTPTPPTKKQNNKTSGGGFLGLFKSSPMSTESKPQPQNNLQGGIKLILKVMWSV